MPAAAIFVACVRRQERRPRLYAGVGWCRRRHQLGARRRRRRRRRCVVWVVVAVVAVADRRCCCCRRTLAGCRRVATARGRHVWCNLFGVPRLLLLLLLLGRVAKISWRWRPRLRRLLPPRRRRVLVSEAARRRCPDGAEGRWSGVGRLRRAVQRRRGCGRQGRGPGIVPSARAGRIRGHGGVCVGEGGLRHPLAARMCCCRSSVVGWKKVVIFAGGCVCVKEVFLEIYIYILQRRLKFSERKRSTVQR